MNILPDFIKIVNTTSLKWLPLIVWNKPIRIYSYSVQIL